jgi:hypothetical protein
VAKIPKILIEKSVEHATIHPEGRRSRQKEVGEKTKRKVKARPRASTWDEKRFFGWGPLFFFFLGNDPVPAFSWI